MLRHFPSSFSNLWKTFCSKGWQTDLPCKMGKFEGESIRQVSKMNIFTWGFLWISFFVPKPGRQIVLQNWRLHLWIHLPELKDLFLHFGSCSDIYSSLILIPLLSTPTPLHPYILYTESTMPISTLKFIGTENSPFPFLDSLCQDHRI
jgi:hypothetical protein